MLKSTSTRCENVENFVCINLRIQVGALSAFYFKLTFVTIFVKNAAKSYIRIITFSGHSRTRLLDVALSNLWEILM